MKQTLITTVLALGFLNSLMTPAAHAQRYLVNGHPATAGEEQVLASYGFDAGAGGSMVGASRGTWHMPTSLPSRACRSVTTCSVCRSTATRYRSFRVERIVKHITPVKRMMQTGTKR